MKKEIVKYSYLIILSLAISSILSYFYQVAMGILLPKREFGIFGVSLAIFYIGSVLTQSTFSWSGTRRMASSEAKEVSRVLRTTIFGNLVLATLASALILYYSYKSKIYFIPNLLIAITLILSAFTNSYTSFLRAMKKFVHLACAGVIGAFLKLLFGVTLVMLGIGAIGGIAGLTFSSAVVLAYLVYCSSKIKLPPSKGFVRDMIPETFFVSVIFIGITFIINSSIVFMRMFYGNDVAAGNYNAALTIARGTFFIAGALMTVLFPYVSSRFDEMRLEYSFYSVKYMILLVLPVSVSMAVNPKIWLNLFFGEKYLEAAEILRFLSIGIGLASLAFVISSNLVAFEKFKVPALLLFLASIIQIIFILSSNDLVMGSAASVLASSLFSAVLLLIYYARKFYFRKSIKYVRHIIKIAVAYFIFSGILLLAPFGGRFLSLVEISISFLMYLLVLSIFCLFDEKDVKILFSPFPSGFTELLRKIVGMLNKIGYRFFFILLL